MDNRKRPRLEILNGTLRRGNATQNSIILSQNLAEDLMEMSNGSTTVSSATTTTTGLPGNVFLALCDDNSNESHDAFIAIDNSCIKRERNMEETTQRHVGVNVGLTAINAQTAAAILPASVQLPSGCEIYLVKEYIDPPPLTPTNAPRTVITSTTTATQTAITTKNNNQKMKLDNTSINSIITTATTTLNTGNPITKNCFQIRRKFNNNDNNTLQQPIIYSNNNNNNKNTTIRVIDERSDFQKQSELLEAYKKRDDKRRATHNEVERRRRDKINSWIFKLKEMLPTEIPNYVPNESDSCNHNSNSNSSTSDQQGQSNNNNNNTNNNNRNCRNLPCDSKSQILIKACEYIKSMQQELKNLRDCLTEQENIRQRNEQLQNELNQLKNVHLAVSVMEEDEDDVIDARCSNHLSVAASDDAVDGHVDDLTHNLNSNPNSNFNVTLNSLNNLGGGDSLFMSTTANTSLVAVVDGKRELLMREFVD